MSRTSWRPSVHRLAGMALVAAFQAFQAVPASAASSSSPATEVLGASQRQPPCGPPTFGRDTLTVVCAVAVGEPQSFHVRVHLTGSHDDTTASMEVALGDAPLACEAGSKTRTEGEEGDVTLDCRFTATPQPGDAPVLRVAAKWFHAQYVHFEVDRRRP